VAEWTTEAVLYLPLERCTKRACSKRYYSELTDDANTHWHAKSSAHLTSLAAHDAEIRFGERERILGGLLRLPITRTQAWDRGWYSVSLTDAISVVRGEQP